MSDVAELKELKRILKKVYAILRRQYETPEESDPALPAKEK